MLNSGEYSRNQFASVCPIPTVLLLEDLPELIEASSALI
jgi:hypothetical protein